MADSTIAFMRSETKDIKKEKEVEVLNIPRIVFIIILLLSLFIVLKSFIATYNIEQWSNDIWLIYTKEQKSDKKQRFTYSMYIEKLNNIQQQWKVFRYLGVGLIILSCYGIFLTSKNENETVKTFSGIEQNKRRDINIYDKRNKK